MERRLRTNLLLVAALGGLGALIIYDPAPGDKPASVPVPLEADIGRVAVHENGELRFALERGGDSWRLAAPVKLPAAKFQVDALLAALHEPASRRYLLTDADPGKLGLASPEWRVRVDDAELRLGDRAVLGNQRYVQLGEHVYLVNDVLSRHLQRNPLDYASKRVLPEDRRLEALVLPSGQRIERAGTGWSLAPDDPLFSADAIQRLVFAWQDARALRVNAAHSVPRDGEVTVEFSDGSTLRFGVELRERNLLLARAEPAVTYTLPIAAAAELLQLARGGSDEPAVTE